MHVSFCLTVWNYIYYIEKTFFFLTIYVSEIYHTLCWNCKRRLNHPWCICLQEYLRYILLPKVTLLFVYLNSVFKGRFRITLPNNILLFSIQRGCSTNGMFVSFCRGSGLIPWYEPEYCFSVFKKLVLTLDSVRIIKIVKIPIKHIRIKYFKWRVRYIFRFDRLKNLTPQ